MQLTENFHLDEFKCNDGTPVPEEYLENVKLLAKNLQVLRDFVGKPITINSGYRSPAYNKKVGGASRSQHKLATAADIKIRGIRPREVQGIIEELIKDGRMHNGGLGYYSSFTHYDVRENSARWKG